jgi:YVTN family beta-propeller protein
MIHDTLGTTSVVLEVDMRSILRFPYLLLSVLSVYLAAHASVAPPQKYVYAANLTENYIAVINPTTLAVVKHFAVPNPYGIAISPIGQRLYITDWNEASVTVLNSQSGEFLATIPVGIIPEAVAVTPNGRYVYVGNVGSFDVSVIDAEALTVVATIPTSLSPYGIATSPDGTEVYVANASGNETDVLVIDTATNTIADTISVPVAAQGLALTPNGEQVWVATEGNEVAVIDTASRSVTRSISLSCSKCYAAQDIVFSPTGNRAYVSMEFGHVATFNTSNYKMLDLIAHPYNPYFSIVSEAVSYDCSDPSNENKWRVYVGSSGDSYSLPGAVSVIDPEKQKVVKTVEIGIGSDDLAATPQGIAVTPCSALP